MMDTRDGYRGTLLGLAVGSEAKNLTRRLGHRVLPSAVMCLFACEGRQRSHVLRAPSAEACQRNAYFVELPPGLVFILNGSQRDSSGTARWINEVLAKRDTGGKVVNIRADSSRGHDVSWLVPAIVDVGGRAYQFDSSCKIEIPGRL